MENVAHAPEQIATTKRVSTAKSLKFTDISGNISVSLFPVTNFCYCSQLIGITREILNVGHMVLKAHVSSVVVMFFTVPARVVLRSRSTFQILEGSL